MLFVVVSLKHHRFRRSKPGSSPNLHDTTSEEFQELHQNIHRKYIYLQNAKTASLLKAVKHYFFYFLLHKRQKTTSVGI